MERLVKIDLSVIGAVIDFNVGKKNNNNNKTDDYNRVPSPPSGLGPLNIAASSNNGGQAASTTWASLCAKCHDSRINGA